MVEKIICSFTLYAYMGVIKIVLPDDLEKRLRDVVPARKGALSEFITNAIKEKLERLEKEKKKLEGGV